MTPIDLKTFADYSSKIPGTLLAPEAKNKKPSAFKLLFAHGIDFQIVAAMAFVMESVFKISLKGFAMTNRLELAFQFLDKGSLILFFFPLMLFTYFFGCYFLNHGQTLGMYFMKKRVSLQETSFRESALWAANSLALCLSFGMSWVLTKAGWQSFHDHDYLYQELTTYRESKAIDLLPMTLDEEVEEVPSFQEAA